MNNLLNIKTPAQDQAREYKAEYGLLNQGLANLSTVYWNLPPEALVEEIIFRREGMISRDGPVVVETGKHTARAAQDKMIVREPSSQDHVWWGEYNRPLAADKFDELFGRLQGFLQGRDLFVQDCYAGADPNYRLPIRIVTEYAWHSLFARNMFITPSSREEYRQHVPEFTVICAPSFQASESIDGTRSPTVIALSFEQRMCIIGNSAYAGEIKKAIFTVMNYLLPLDGIMTMHCSANQGPQGDTALFFGLSGTGKTTLSADPSRGLIGDDEHGWSDEGIFNFEDGCYAKVIQLSASAEPQIFAATHRFGTILENVVADPLSRLIDLNDDRITENTRASYPLTFIGNAIPSKMGGHPRNIILLTCDAQGVMPPLARLTPDQALYHFISGYTSKVGGTEIGLGAEPKITFSTCFGAPFMVHHPAVYADLLKRKILRYGATCWLLNTGWIGGAYGVGKRISIRHTRALLNAALAGQLSEVEYREDPVFGFKVPASCPGVPDEILNPAVSWARQDDYWTRYRQLASRFVDNFQKFAADCPPEVRAAGPHLS
ncbi:MAG TPA: phosphoenolpyruvate carboxykinase (ATP) [Aggregatilineaceae bacterium]|nr:phosphoenolpyruvate carboxykinase (ATP) [Aggregatilineaceae bacterium]